MTQCHLVIQTIALSARSSLSLNAPRDGDSTTPLGSSLQYLVALFVKKFFLMTT